MALGLDEVAGCFRFVDQAVMFGIFLTLKLAETTNIYLTLPVGAQWRPMYRVVQPGEAAYVRLRPCFHLPVSTRIRECKAGIRLGHLGAKQRDQRGRKQLTACDQGR